MTPQPGRNLTDWVVRVPARLFATPTFTLRALFAATCVVGVLVGVGRHGLACLVMCGLPVSVLCWQVIVERDWSAKTASIHAAIRRKRYWTAVAASVVLLCVTSLNGGVPADQRTWIVVIGSIIWCLYPASNASRNTLRSFKWVPILLLSYIAGYVTDPRLVERALPIHGRGLFDVASMRYGTRFWPGLTFEHCGLNTQLVERYCGPRPREWITSQDFDAERDGNERVAVSTVVRRPNLARVLALLPSESARRDLLIVLTDRRNMLRVHQSLLLCALDVFGIPDRRSATEWWTNHSDLFRAEYDASVAARLAWGWSAHVRLVFERRQPGISQEQVHIIRGQLRAAGYQEWGSWGGDSAFGAAYEKLERSFQMRGAPSGAIASTDGVETWWLVGE